MIKIITLLQRKEGMTHEEFVRHWEDVHAPMLLKIPEIRRYVQSHVVTERPSPVGMMIEGEIDGIVELWYDDLETLARVWASPAVKDIAEDTHRFIGAMKSFIIDEKVVIPGS